MVDFHWNAADPWTIVSVSEDGEKTGGGGTLQVIRSFLAFDAHKCTRFAFSLPIHTKTSFGLHSVKWLRLYSNNFDDTLHQLQFPDTF